MNTKLMNGKLIRNIYWPNGEKVEASDNIGLHMSATYHGDRDEFWIVQTDNKGREHVRYNPRCVESFAWVEPIEL
ncbi:MAG: hypothetical protein GY938_03285 [Ketobacter sp.]|nr:hypothetical protein [Ketobacter sp.]